MSRPQNCAANITTFRLMLLLRIDFVATLTRNAAALCVTRCDNVAAAGSSVAMKSCADEAVGGAWLRFVD